MTHYGESPIDMGEVHLDEWTEFMHWLYLPVRIPSSDPDQMFTQMGVPPNLGFLRPSIEVAIFDAATTTEHLRDPYVYVSAVRGFATPGNPLNRPGWHCDDFGGNDLNYVWTDRFATQILTNEAPLNISEEDAQSMTDMEDYATLSFSRGGSPDLPTLAVRPVTLGTMYRLTPYVIHCPPDIPAPGGMRSFFKISVSDDRYLLQGNAHNHLLDYDWPMVERASARNPTSEVKA